MEKTIVITVTDEDFEITTTFDNVADANLWLDIAKRKIINDLTGDTCKCQNQPS